METTRTDRGLLRLGRSRQSVTSVSESAPDAALMRPRSAMRRPSTGSLRHGGEPVPRCRENRRAFDAKHGRRVIRAGPWARVGRAALRPRGPGPVTPRVRRSPAPTRPNWRRPRGAAARPVSRRDPPRVDPAAGGWRRHGVGGSDRSCTCSAHDLRVSRARPVRRRGPDPRPPSRREPDPRPPSRARAEADPGDGRRIVTADSARNASRDGRPPC